MLHPWHSTKVSSHAALHGYPKHAHHKTIRINKVRRTDKEVLKKKKVLRGFVRRVLTTAHSSVFLPLQINLSHQYNSRSPLVAVLLSFALSNHPEVHNEQFPNVLTKFTVQAGDPRCILYFDSPLPCLPCSGSHGHNSAPCSWSQTLRYFPRTP